MAETEKKVVKLGGREFLPLDFAARTVRQDHYILTAFRKSGVDKVTPTVDEEPKEYLLRMYHKMLAGGRACEILAAFLMPPGVDIRDWRPSHAAEIQEFLERLNTEEDRQLVNQMTFEMMAGFFKQGLLSLLASLTSSLPTESENGSENSPSIPTPSSPPSTTKPGIGRRLSDTLRALIGKRASDSSTSLSSKS